MCCCCPRLSTALFCFSATGTINAGFWTLFFMLVHLVLAARGWGRYYSSEAGVLGGAILHFLLFVMYVQSVTMMERVGTLVHLLSIVVVATRVLWWNY